VLVEEFRFPPDYWRTMPWVHFNAWQRFAFVRQRNRQLAARKGHVDLEDLMP
jgi:hypothetical protein